MREGWYGGLSNSNIFTWINSSQQRLNISHEKLIYAFFYDLKEKSWEMMTVKIIYYIRFWLKWKWKHFSLVSMSICFFCDLRVTQSIIKRRDSDHEILLMQCFVMFTPCFPRIVCKIKWFVCVVISNTSQISAEHLRIFVRI